MPEGDRRGRLVERDAEFVAIDDAVAAALAGRGACVIFDGPAGIGKTALLEAARLRADRAGVVSLGARGAEMEGDFPYGVVRQLLEPTLRAALPARRRRLLAGVAALAAPAILGEADPGADPADRLFDVIHGLYWVVANLASEAPLMLLVDDLHWADAPSVRLLSYVARRLEGLNVSVVASIRSGEVGVVPRLFDEVARTREARTLRPTALSEDGVAVVLRDQFGRTPAPEFVGACWEVTAGNPLFIRQLAAALIAEGTEPTPAAIGAVSAAAPATIAHATLARLGRLSSDAVQLARSIAVLGLDATLPRCATLARLDEARALPALDALAGTNVVAAGAALAFCHPIVRAAIYEELGIGLRSAMHARAATLLAGEGADLDRVAGHLLRALPTGSLTTITTLRNAAGRSLGVGAPDTAATYLARALEENPPRLLRAELLLELARAEQLARLPGAIAHYQAACQLADDPPTRATAMLEQAAIALYTGDATQALDLVDGALAEMTGASETTVVQAHIWRAVATAHNPRLITTFEEQLPHLRALALSRTEGTRPLALLLAARAAQQGERPEKIRALVELGWEAGAYLTERDSVELFPQGLRALIHCEELERADELIEAARAFALKTGSVILHLTALSHRAFANTRRGELDVAAADLRECIQRARELELWYPVAITLSYCCEALLERPDLADIAKAAEAVPVDAMAELHVGAMLIATRARLRFAAGESPGAISDLHHAGSFAEALRLPFPVGFPSWRSTLALMLPVDERDQAQALVAAELADATRCSQPRQIGIALRALGLLDDNAETGRAKLQQAVSVLADTPARLEYARALVDLGAAHRRSKARDTARQPLRQGLDLALRCGATRLAQHARTELAATGARPRRDRTTGREALTSSELRVANMASSGLSSAQIAQALFVTKNTVDTHLAHIYTKLGINSRKELSVALERRVGDKF